MSNVYSIMIKEQTFRSDEYFKGIGNNSNLIILKYLLFRSYLNVLTIMKQPRS